MPEKGPLTTPWTDKVQPENVLGEYPRPQMIRREWSNLNGLWDFAILPRDANAPSSWDGKILVPFPVESALSGVKRTVGSKQQLWYRRTIDAKKPQNGDRVLLHFGAVDWQCDVFVNGANVGSHQGGYDSFTLDITEQLRSEGPQELIVSVWDPTDQGYQPRGKQVVNPHGIWYTSVTGIWQTVWLESAPATRITSYTVTPDIENSRATFSVNVTSPATNATPAKVRVRVRLPQSDDRKEPEYVDTDGVSGRPLVVNFPDRSTVRLWSPDSPHLYACEIAVHAMHDDKELGPAIDQVDGYFAMREISLGKDQDGLVRLMLNGKPLFQLGTLDQGWWPDGLYTAPTDEALRFDIEMTKKLGFNTIRKHVKVEPDRWYYHCDQLGMLVWQDMPNGDRHIGPNDPDIVRSQESITNFRREWRSIIDDRRNHPCIIAWVPFNEGWGQFQTAEILAWTKEYDPTRLVDGPSGWSDRGVGDMHDIHRYPGPAMPEPEEHRAVVLGEFGGLGLPLEGHLWQDNRNWGYRTYKTRDELELQYRRLIRNLHPLIGQGLAAAIYTQTTDVEGEVNGLMTYDRREIKFDVEKMAELHARLHEPAPLVEIKSVVPTSEKNGQVWRFTLREPENNWMEPTFDDSAWTEGQGGFGERSTPGSVVRTPWKSTDIWLRRTVDLSPEMLPGAHLRIHHDEDANVYINGRHVITLEGYTVDYENEELDEKARQLLKAGENVIAIHCKQTGGGQYIDAGMVQIIEKPRSAKQPR
jgi:beta-galactosidase/beta-glucuronidase